MHCHQNPDYAVLRRRWNLTATPLRGKLWKHDSQRSPKRKSPNAHIASGGAAARQGLLECVGQWRQTPLPQANDAQPQGQPEPQSQPEPIDWLNDRGEHSFLEPSPDMKPPSPGSMKKLQKARLAQKALEIEALRGLNGFDDLLF